MKDRALSMVLREICKTAADGVGDAELLGRFAASGDEAAFELLVRRHQRLVFGVCQRTLRNLHDAEDAFQATFLALAHRARRIRKREALAAWLFRVAYHTALTARAERARRESKERAAGEATAPDDPAATTERREAWAAVDEEVNRLPERFRTAAVLCYLEGKTVDEAARLLGCPRGTVASRLARARTRLHSRLSRRGVGLAVGAAATADGLIRATVRAGVLYGSGKAAGQGVSLTAVALAKKVVAAMFVKKLTTGVTILAAVIAGALLLGGGMTAWLRVNAATTPPAAQQAAKDKAAPGKGATATAVTVSRPVRRDVAPFEDFAGRLDFTGSIPVVARVSGLVVDEVSPSKSAHTPGAGFAAVKKGDLLVQIDPAPFKEALAKAEAKHDVAVGPEREAAAVAVHRARQDLEAARIVAPADGQIQLLYSLKGDKISGTWERPHRLLTLNTTFTMGVQFEMDERTYLRYRRAVAARDVQGEGDPLSIALADETGFPHEGLLASFDDHFNSDKGTIAVRGFFPDPGRTLLPGMSARVRVPFGKPVPSLEVSDEAIFTDQAKHYVWVVNDHNVAERREVQLGSEGDGMRVVKEGLGPDDSVVVAGGKDLYAGDKVEPYRTAMPGSKPAPRP